MDISIGTLQKEIGDLYKKLGTWQRVADHYGVHRSVVWRIANQDYVPRANIIRKKLNLPQIIERALPRNSQGRFVSIPKDQ